MHWRHSVALKTLLVLSCCASRPTLLHAASKNTICQINADCDVFGQECLLPPASTLQYAGAGIKVCRCARDFRAGVNCSDTCDGATGNGNACAGHGECLYDDKVLDSIPMTAGMCVCDEGWVGLTGSQCSATCTRGMGNQVCSGRGVCTAVGVARAFCACHPGFRGQACEIECAGGAGSPCSGHGTCLGDGSCSCQTAWRLNDCSKACPGQIGFQGTVACNAHGECTDAGFCECDAQWRGEGCLTRCPQVNGVPCAANGVCDDQAKCLCNKGFRGNACDRECQGGSQNPCNGNGICKEDATCECKLGWVGAVCNIMCPGGESNTCSDRGTCQAVGEYSKCNCRTVDGGLINTYTGENCEIAVYAQKMRDDNATKVDTAATVFRPSENWPVLVSPLVVLGIAITSLVLTVVFAWINQRIAMAKSHQEAILRASMQGNQLKGGGTKRDLLRRGSTRMLRPNNDMRTNSGASTGGSLNRTKSMNLNRTNSLSRDF